MQMSWIPIFLWLKLVVISQDLELLNLGANAFFFCAYLNVCIQNAVIKLRIFCFLYSNEFKCIIILWLSIGSDIFLHRDKNLMPQSPAAWSAWNFLGNTDKVCVTYWLNILQVIKISPFSLN